MSIRDLIVYASLLPRLLVAGSAQKDWSWVSQNLSQSFGFTWVVALGPLNVFMSSVGTMRGNFKVSRSAV